MDNRQFKKQGLYDPFYEHDSCGIGFISNIKGEKSHKIIKNGIEILKNLAHRGGCGAEKNTGDGAGILIQIPNKFFKKVCEKINISLPRKGNYGIGVFFLPQANNERESILEKIELTVKEQGQKVLGWRKIPTNDLNIGKTARDNIPYIMQLFIERRDKIENNVSFERNLYVITKILEKYSLNSKKNFHIVSMSSRTIVYKGMLTAYQVEEFYPDLMDKDMESAIALIHSRYSTNTFPSWGRAHPYRFIIHNGEINTLRGNINWMKARESIMQTDIFGCDVNELFPVINPEGSDSTMFDNCLEFLTHSGRPIEHSIMMMIPEPWSNNINMDEDIKAFYEYYSCMMEPWDGPASIAFTDGIKIGAVLDRNGLRPSRYYVTKDDMVIMASEVGVLNIEPENVLYKERLKPGRMLLIDTKVGRIIDDKEIKKNIAKEKPYKKWVVKNLVLLKNIKYKESVDTETFNVNDNLSLTTKERVFGYTYEDCYKMILPMARNGVDPVGSMGHDSPLAVLSDKPQILFNYFKQLFAQVTNPPIDSIKEEIIISKESYLGSEGNLLDEKEKFCRRIKIPEPIIDNKDLLKIKKINESGLKSITIPITFKVNEMGIGFKSSLESIFDKADKAIEEGTNIIILSDRYIDKDNAPIPSLLAVSALHHHLIRKGTRTLTSIIIETGEAREVHHFSLLIGYGAAAVNPYLAFEVINNLIEGKHLKNTNDDTARNKYISGAVKGIVKVMSKMGIATIQGYQGAQIFEAVGLSNDFIDKYFTSTASRIGGIGLDIIEEESVLRHMEAYDERYLFMNVLNPGGTNQYRNNNEFHLINPESVHKLQISCRDNNYELYKEYTDLVNNQTKIHCTLRGLMDFNYLDKPIPIDEVESVESICKRFKTGAMSYGSLSKETHESLAIAMNRIGGKSNTGEGGEDPDRFTPDSNGDLRSSAIKQVASGRFGVTSNYLTNSKELQIKIVQGAKPGEGGQIPGNKVYPWIAKTRGTTTGVGLISPPPHHDIYSIEDLAELIHDLKNSNREARVSVKLVSAVGVGTIAAGVAKGRADVVLISGYDGGTGASPETSIRHAGLPWELGLSETHQTLLLNNLRSRIVIETDGKLLTGRDVVVAALLGAEEYGFSTAPLIVLGCVMMRVCNLNTCPVGITTQNPLLRAKFKGNPDHVVNYMRFIAQDIREHMAKLGFRNMDEMIGRTDKLRKAYGINHWKAKDLDFSKIFYIPKVSEDVGRFCQIDQDHELNNSLDVSKLLSLCKPAIEKCQKVNHSLSINNTNRVVGTILGNEISKKYGNKGLPEGTIKLKFNGSAGQSFGAFVPKGVNMELEGDANDYFGKGLSGGKLVVYPPQKSTFQAENSIIIGNVSLYGATDGEAYIRGIAGERFCVRNSGARAVIEGIGDHGCEYMTGGEVIILGLTGKNFAAGMSGGIAYIFDKEKKLKLNCNMEMVNIVDIDDEKELNKIKDQIIKHMRFTKSSLAESILGNWKKNCKKFLKVLPKDYERMMIKIDEVIKKGLTGDEALMAAFEANFKGSSRISGN